MTSTETRPIAPSRPRFRLTLRIWLALVLAIGTALGWYLHRVRVQGEAVSRIVNGGGGVRYDWDLSRLAGVAYPTIRPSAPISPWRRWLIDRLGPDWVSDVSAVYVGPKDTASVMANLGEFHRLRLLVILWNGASSLTDRQFASIRNSPSIRALIVNAPISARAINNVVEALPHLQQLRLTHAKLGDDDLEHLEALTSLEYLDIPGTRISNAGLAHLSRLSHLKSLHLIYGSRVSDLSPIANLTQMKRLILPDSPITDTGLAPVSNFLSLRSLTLSNTKITDAGLATLSELPSLTGIRLDDTAITDAGLLHLRKLPALETLTLLRTGVTDAGLSHLSGLKSLKRLNVKGTSVTPAGISAFEAANPGVRVSR